MLEADMITFLSTKIPKVDISLEKMVKPIHHHGSGENQRSLEYYSLGDQHLWLQSSFVLF